MKRKAALAALVAALTWPTVADGGPIGCPPGGCLRGSTALAEDPPAAREPAAPPEAAPPSRFLAPRELAGASQVWRSSGHQIAEHSWCRALQPAQDWKLNYCSAEGGLDVKVLTYNLFWWNSFGVQFQNGNGGSASRLIRDSNAEVPFDFMAFQECEDGHRVLHEAGLLPAFEAIELGHALSLAYRKEAWTLLEHGLVDVAEDQPGLYGRRFLLRARFQHVATNKTVLVANHHGPLRLNTGGVCGGVATAWNILRAIGERAQERDAVILLGDFNAEAGSETVREVDRYIYRHYTGVSFDGVDHLYSSCEPSRVKERKNLGSAGSDHDALMEILTL